MSVPDVVRQGGRTVASALTRRWPSHSRLFLVGEGVSWSIDQDLVELAATAAGLGIPIAPRRLLSASQGQAVFFGSQFTLLREPWLASKHRLATAYFHGRPGTPGFPEFDECFRMLREHHDELARVQVSHSEMHDLVLSSGIDPAKVLRIPIGINLAYFSMQTRASRSAARSSLGLPDDVFVVGSFHKDGVGMGDGEVPKSIKGPDTLLQSLELLHRSLPELHVVLAGPARGYVRAGLDRLGIPYRHVIARQYAAVADLYQVLDAYVVPSRQEGGPKGLLEAMASGVPVVTTRVGQAMDLVRHGENAWMVEPGDSEGLAECLSYVASRPAELSRLLDRGAETAAANSYSAQLPLWRDFLHGLVELPR